jgi:hypothetical protein
VNSPPIALSVPPRTLSSVTFTDGTLEDLGDWVERLPADPVEAARQLRNGLMELNRAEGYFTARFPELELLRPKVRGLCRSLVASSRARLQRVQEAATEAERLAQALQMELTTGYRVAIVETMDERVPLEAGSPPDSPTGMAVASIHRALTGFGQLLLRALQCNVPTPPELWEEVHQLHRLAEEAGVLEEVVRDGQHRWRRDTRILDAWLRVVLLGTCDPYSLRPASLGALHDLLEDWTRFVDVTLDAPGGGAAAIVDVSGDEPPARAALVELEADPSLRYADTARLADQLTRHLARRPREEDGIVLPPVEADDLARQGLRLWGVEATRGTDRMPFSGTLELCVGMAAVHRHLRDAAKVEDAPLALAIADASPGGYGLVSPGALPSRLQSGELLGVRKAGTGTWHLAVVRWVAGGARDARLGVQLLSPRAEPAAARLEDDRDGKWTPVLLLPEIAALKQDAALIAPRGRFERGQSLQLNRGNGTTVVELGRGRASAESYQSWGYA